jgi:hypothetical protein
MQAQQGYASGGAVQKPPRIKPQTANTRDYPKKR